jgi:hypothetical protein
VLKLDRNSGNCVVSEVPACRPLRSIEHVQRFRATLDELVAAAKGSAEVRGRVHRVVTTAKGPAGLVVDVRDHEVFMPASHSVGLVDLPARAVCGLPVTGLARLDAERERLILSLRDLYRHSVVGATPPRPGQLVPAISYAVMADGTEWHWLLPRKRLGVARLQFMGLAPAEAREQCGWLGTAHVLRMLSPEQPDDPPALEVEPAWETASLGEGT